MTKNAAPLAGPESIVRPPDGVSPSFPIVGIGASAGGLVAFEAFFSGMPADTDPGMAFVLVQHLAPDHKSMLTDLIRRYTRMRVCEVEDGMPVLPNHAYIIPPNCDMAFLNGVLHLLPPAAPRGQRLPIDFLFRSLAQDQCERAIGIVLSGTGSDGTPGARAIKDAGGMVMAQRPGSCEFDGMPRSVIAADLADYVLPPAEMAAQLIAYASHAFGKPARPDSVHAARSEGALRKIFILLRAQTSHDFSQYKPSTINRRIERRMAVQQIDTMDDYVAYLQRAPAEVEALFRDVLIGVTCFFRDAEVFQMLERDIVPQLFDARPPGTTVRIWSTGCSTGEEAYSLAILLRERMEALKQSYIVQVFATDIDSRAIATARAGVYPASISADVSPERLARFFVAEPGGGGYRIHKGIRDMLVFSEQDVIKDPPFSRLDLISCRNLMIYFGAQLQKKLIPLFHYALNPGGMLLLGTSEGVGDFVDLFAVLDRKLKLYRRTEDYQSTQRVAISRCVPELAALGPGGRHAAKKPEFALKPSLRELAEQALLRRLPASAVLVNARGDIFYLHGRTGMYLEPAPGEVGVNNILSMAREGLRRDLTMALHKVAKTGEVVRCPGLRVRTNGHFSLVDLTLCPVPVGAAATPDSHLYLAILEAAPAPAPGPERPAAAAPGAETDLESETELRNEALKQELRAKDEYLQTTHEELESSNEELKSSNEEMQSVNEELQSTNEELETSKEELQSVNEELATVNAELQIKVLDLSRANNDMNNLLAGTGIGTIFVDHQLRILRFTPAASTIINLIQSDTGRPVAHIVSNLVGYDCLVRDTQVVLDTLASRQVEVQTTAGGWYTMRIQPYRTLDNVVEGAVISFIDISEMVRTRDALRQANALLRLAALANDANAAVIVRDLGGRITAWNPAAARMYGWSEAEALQLDDEARIPADAREQARAAQSQLDGAFDAAPCHTLRLDKRGAALPVSVLLTALRDAAGALYAVASTERLIDGVPHGQ